MQSLSPKGGGGVAELKPFGGDWRAGRKRKPAHPRGEMIWEGKENRGVWF